MKKIIISEYKDPNLALIQGAFISGSSNNAEVLSGVIPTTTPAPEPFNRIASKGGEGTAEISPNGLRYRKTPVWQLEGNTNLPVGYREEVDFS